MTPIPGATPDVSQPWWWVPYLNAERDKVPFVGNVNGIAIATSAVGLKPADFEGNCGDIRRTPASEADSHPRGPLPDYLPAGTIRSEAETHVAFWCDDALLSAESQFEVVADDTVGRRGATFTVYRYRGEARAEAYAPAERWASTTINGYPAALATPILADLGLGTSYLVVYDGEFVTRVMASNLPLNELVKITEGLF